jgi:hypothetical protein
MVGAASAIARTKDIVTLIKDAAITALHCSILAEEAQDAASIIQWCDEIFSHISPEDQKSESAS